eukprot:gene7919-17410_t
MTAIKEALNYYKELNNGFEIVVPKGTPQPPLLVGTFGCCKEFEETEYTYNRQMDESLNWDEG